MREAELIRSEERAAHEAGWGTRELVLPPEVWERVEGAEVVLEVGCGTGHVLEGLRKRCRGVVVGMDADLGLLRLARGQYEGLRIFAGDAQRGLALREGCVEVALSSDVIEHLPDPAAHVREVWRVLRPGGIYVVKTPNGWVDTIYWMAKRTLEKRREGKGLRTAWRGAREALRAPGSHCSPQTAGSLLRLMRWNGFRLVKMVKQPPSTTQEQKMAGLRGILGGAVRLAGRVVRRLPVWAQWSLVGVFERRG